jgi:imidazole glycerol-phosphate synthase subunit HisH
MSKNNTIAVIDYNMSNMFSIENALKTLDLKPKITSDYETILSCDGAVLPGVGSFPEAMKNLKKLNLDNAIIDFIESGKPFLGICLGFQLLFDKSDEILDTTGLGIISGEVKSFSNLDNRMRVPHVGWNLVTKKNSLNIEAFNDPLNNIGNDEYFYFVHSNFVQPIDNSCAYTLTQYEEFDFCSSIMKDNIFACQFHPEKSGKQGMQILNNIFNK